MSVPLVGSTSVFCSQPHVKPHIKTLGIIIVTIYSIKEVIYKEKHTTLNVLSI